MILFLTLLIFISAKAHIPHYNESEAKFYSNYAKLTNCAEKPLNINCPKCLNPGDGYKFFFFYQTTRINKFNYRFLILYNDIQKKYLISFSGPSVNNHIYIKYIYSAGFSLVKRYRFQLEKEFYLIYFKKIRKILSKKISKINSSGRKDYNAYFVGHSLGASIATLAAFDMQQLKIVKNPIVFAYAPLRLGDATFVALVNSYISVYRIVKKSDFLVRIPNCYFSPNYNIWRCFNQKLVRQFIMKQSFPLKIYVKNYLKYFTQTNIILHKAILFAKKKYRYLEKVNKKGKILKTKNNFNLSQKMLIDRKKNIAKNDISKKKALLKELKLKRSKFLKSLQNIKRQLKKSKRLKDKLNIKKAKKFNRKINNSINNLKKIKELPKKIKQDLKLLNNKDSKKILKERPKNKKEITIILRKLRKFLIKAARITKKILKKYKIIKNKLRKSRINKGLKNIKNFKKINLVIQKENKENLKNSKKEKKEKKNKKLIKYLSPIHKPQFKREVKYNTYIPILQDMKGYSPIDTYFTFIYYSQPIGYHILYNDVMTNYNICQYINGTSVCEKVFALPNEFNSQSHFQYFNLNFNICK